MLEIILTLALKLDCQASPNAVFSFVGQKAGSSSSTSYQTGICSNNFYSLSMGF